MQVNVPEIIPADPGTANTARLVISLADGVMVIDRVINLYAIF
jgi:hypothetical protein